MVKIMVPGIRRALASSMAFVCRGRVQYGATSDSQVVATNTTTVRNWLLCKVTDATGNTETINYTAAAGTAVPSVISWTPTSYGASTYQYTMTFNYGTNVSVPVYAGYAAGVVVQNPYLLGSVVIASSGTAGTTGTLKNYVLSYQAGPATGRNQLIQVKECSDAAATNCLQPTQFTYQSGAMGMGGARLLAFSAPLTPRSYAAYDLNGDGANDLTWYDGSSWKVYLQDTRPWQRGERRVSIESLGRGFGIVSSLEEFPCGGHFAAFEEPELLAEDLRAFFRPLRVS